MASDWIKTKEMAEALNCSRRTLQRLQAEGFLKEGNTQHWIKVNPLAPRSTHLWHKTRTLMRMGRI